MMTRQEMKKLLDELDHKHVNAQSKQTIEKPDDESRLEGDKPKKRCPTRNLGLAGIMRHVALDCAPLPGYRVLLSNQL
jgi:hypothetical protein